MKIMKGFIVMALVMMFVAAGSQAVSWSTGLEDPPYNNDTVLKGQ